MKKQLNSLLKKEPTMANLLEICKLLEQIDSKRVNKLFDHNIDDIYYYYNNEYRYIKDIEDLAPMIRTKIIDLFRGIMDVLKNYDKNTEEEIIKIKGVICNE